MVNSVCVGMIMKDQKLVQLILRQTRHDVTYELNNWFVNYFRMNHEPIIQLPPLDDWTQSEEYPSLWNYKFQSNRWSVTTYIETLEKNDHTGNG